MPSPKDVHAADQSLAQVALASAEIATMYKTLLVETKDSNIAMELTKSYINAVAIAGQLGRSKESE